MSKITELREKRAKLWSDTKAFLDTHQKDGILSPEDNATYERMENDVVALGHEVERLERQAAIDRELASPVSAPLTAKPETGKPGETRRGTASDAYKSAFWNVVRSRYSPEIRNALEEGVDSEGGYLVPETYENRLLETLADFNIMRQVAHVFRTSSSAHKIPLVATKGEAAWVDEEGAIPESDDSFGITSIGAYKVATMVKISDELLADSVFDLESYFAREIARRIGTKEEQAFIAGDGTGKPAGIFTPTIGGEVGVTTAGAAAITADEILDLYYSLKPAYRDKANWIMNETTVKALRKLKDSTGNYLWAPALKQGEVDTLLGKKLYTSVYAPEIAAGNRTIAFGDYSNYWIADRQGISMKRLNELYAVTGQVGFLATKRVDGRVIMSEGIKLLCQKTA